MCTVEKRGNLFILTLTGPGEHRLNPTFIDTIRSALSDIRSQSQSSSALVTVADGNYFSNGFDLKWAATSAQSLSSPPDFRPKLSLMVDRFKPLLADLFSLPMPTIAAVTGHASAAGVLLALSHDYVIMRKDRAVMYMSELDLGMTFPDYFGVMIREKVGSAIARREMMLAARKVRGEEAVRFGIVDEAVEGRDTVMKRGVEVGERVAGRRWNGEVYAEIRKSLYPGICGLLGLSTRAIVMANAKL